MATSADHQTKSTVEKYARALIKGDESTLNRMTAGQEGQAGGVGARTSRVQKLQQSGVKDIAGVFIQQNRALVEFSSSGQRDEIPCIGMFEVQGDDRVKATWRLYTQS